MRKVEVIRALNRTLDVLRGGWCQGTFAKDADGLVCNLNDSVAKCFCLSGAVQRATRSGDMQGRVFNILKREVEHRYPAACGSIVDFNDDGSVKKGDVLRLVRQARNRYAAA